MRPSPSLSDGTSTPRRPSFGSSLTTCSGWPVSCAYRTPTRYASAILDGQRLQKVRDHEGQPLTDERLREYARPDFPWVDDLYRDSSALVHLSAKHWYITIAKTDDAER